MDFRVFDDLSDVAEIVAATKAAKPIISTSTDLGQSQAGRTARKHIVVWVGLVAITGMEVLFASRHMRPATLLGVLASLSIIQAVLIVSCFMRSRFEKLRLTLWMVSVVVFCVALMMVFFFPDSFRLLQLRR